ncbi:hypothetical protein MY5147_000097 [Beauveria neobassiana]
MPVWTPKNTFRPRCRSCFFRPVDEFAALWQIAMQGVACDMLINHGTGLTRFTH